MNINSESCSTKRFYQLLVKLAQLILSALVLIALPELYICSAQEMNTTLTTTISELIESSSMPDEVIFVISENGQLYRAQGEVIPMSTDGQYLIATNLPFKSNELTYAVLLVPNNSNAEIKILPQREFNSDSRGHLSGASQSIEFQSKGFHSEDAIKSQILENRNRIEQLLLEDQKQQEILVKLRRDAEIIGGLGRIVEVKEELNKIKLASDAIDRDIQSLENLLNVTKTLPKPLNFARREVALTKSLLELANSARSLERIGNTNSQVDLQDSEQNLERRLALVNSSKYEQLDKLESEYERLSSMLKQIETRYPDIETTLINSEGAKAALPD